MLFLRSQFSSDYSNKSAKFGLHAVQVESGELYTFVPSQSHWILDRLTAGRYHFPEIHEDQGQVVFTEISRAELSSLLSDALANDTEERVRLLSRRLPATGAVPLSLTSAELGIPDSDDG